MEVGEFSGGEEGGGGWLRGHLQFRELGSDLVDDVGMRLWVRVLREFDTIGLVHVNCELQSTYR